MDRHKEIENNADALFRYCSAIDDGIEKWYVVPDETFRSKFEGLNIVVFGTLEYKLLLIFAEKFISSFLLFEGMTLRFNVDEKEQEEFEKIRNFRQLVRQWFRGDIVHLQHGIIFGDISGYLNKTHERIALICSVCEREYEYCKTLPPTYPMSAMKLTGLAKYDILDTLKRRGGLNKHILFAPSFDRKVLSKDQYSPAYKNSAHFAYINDMLNSEKLNSVLKEMGYTLIFKPHYLMRNNMIDFTLTENVKVLFDEISRYEIYELSDLMITDYSGIAFEYAYLQKPMLYAHIAENTKFQETYFCYQEDGFGEICYDTETLVDTVIRYLETGCHMPNVYKERVEQFFTFKDGKNCERIYGELMKLPDTRKTKFD